MDEKRTFFDANSKWLKTLHITPYSSKTWRKIAAKPMIPKDWGEGGYQASTNQ